MIFKIKSFLELIRYKNLAIIILIQFVIKFHLINKYLDSFALTNINFSIFLFALVSIVASGYIINDIYDINIDKINKPETQIVDKKILKNNAIKLYYLLNFLGLTSGFYCAFQIEKFWFGFIFIFFVWSLYVYSKLYKRSFLIGNIQVAMLTALSIVTLSLFDLIPVGIKISNGSQVVFIIIFCYAIFAFMVNLIREIIKDLEDREGDIKLGSQTLAIRFGEDKTKKTIIVLILLKMSALAYFQFFQYSVVSSTFSVDLSYWGANINEIIYVFFIQLLNISLIYRIIKAKNKSDFTLTSFLCKLIMFFGIMSIPVFTYLHIS